MVISRLSRKQRNFLRGMFTKKMLNRIRGLRNIKNKLNSLEENQKAILQNKYEKLKNNPYKQFKINNEEFKIYSQNGEDGILLHIFSKIGVKDFSFVEFGIEEGRECNTANLSINFGWKGLLIDGSKDNVIESKKYYHQTKKIKETDVKIVHQFVTKKNINSIILSNDLSGEIDLLSIDIDGNDYHIWKEIDVINPRVVVIEYNAFFGDEKSLTVKYDSSFDRYKKHRSGKYYGASLAALTKLAKEKGYILVGCDSNGINAFFVRKNLAKKFLSEISVKKAYYPRREYGLRETIKQFEIIKSLEYDQI